MIQFTNKSAQYFFKLCKFIYLTNMPNYSSRDFGLPNSHTLFHRFMVLFNKIVVFILIMSEFIGLYTQQNIPLEKKLNSYLFCVVHPAFYNSIQDAIRKKDMFSKLVYDLTITLKKLYNNLDTEQEMMTKSKRYTVAYFFSIPMLIVSYGVEGLVMKIITGRFVNIIIPAWPDYNDRSQMAEVIGYIIYLIFWSFVLQFSGLYVLTMSIFIALQYQFKNLCEYFTSLNEIFEENITQKEKEAKFERGLIEGIKLHCLTLRCSEEVQKTCNVVVRNQILVNTVTLVLLLLQFTTAERSATTSVVTAVAMLALLYLNVMFMWNAGDITVEASNLPYAMFSCGWHNCSGLTSRRVRKLIVVATNAAQNPVTIKVFAIFELSHSAYLSIVKTSYSVFSVIY